MVAFENGKTEICYSDFKVAWLLDRLDEYVVGLDVSMNDLFLLEKVQSKEHLLQNDSDLGFWELPILF